MKKFLRNLALIGVTLFAYDTANAQTVSVTADLKSLFNSAQATKTQACFSLTDGAGNQLSNPRTSSGVIVNTTTQCVSPDGAGHISTTVIANDQITPTNSIYTVTYMYNGRAVHGDIFQFALADGTENLNIKTSLSTSPAVSAPTGDQTYLRLDGGNGPLALLSVTGTSTLANVNLGAGNILTVATIKQIPNTAFLLADPLGLSHFFISGSFPYTNTFVQGNGSGVVFLGSAAKTSVADTTGNIVTQGLLILQTSSGTLPAQINNDTSGGIDLTTNGVATLSLRNAGPVIINAPGMAVQFRGATSGTINVQASAIAGAGVLTLPGGLTDQLVSRTSTDTLTNKIITNLGITGGATNALLRFNSSAQVINGNTTDDGTTFSTGTVKFQAQVGVSQGSGLKHQRVSTGSIGAASRADVTLTWTSTFPDANYTIVGCSILDTSAAGTGMRVERIRTKTAAAITVQVVNDAAGALTGTLECGVMHD